ncbi:MAG: hypothetical protein A3E38_01155 [Candidatus Moranbacteria bacterium RIFCSPHIGHO2_12_FULL_54_9]|nr:MAG: hypothetical protein A2878_03520 [Candidatus Moranbacteria bacterium RIFCSPHIGHO2_01_FULL_54_31]OGI24812.1 MAG: hypothetical protein A3E38_01155 [Candidatus Moranbacteria bacterium RIFCSPHIGHO2_12_FULL_54_9]
MARIFIKREEWVGSLGDESESLVIKTMRASPVFWKCFSIFASNEDPQRVSGWIAVRRDYAGVILTP